MVALEMLESQFAIYFFSRMKIMSWTEAMMRWTPEVKLVLLQGCQANTALLCHLNLLLLILVLVSHCRYLSCNRYS